MVVKRNNVAFLRNCESHIRALSLVALDLNVSEVDIDDERTVCSSGDLEGRSGSSDEVRDVSRKLNAFSGCFEVKRDDKW